MSSVESPLIFPLTPQEIKDLKKGKALMKHYHNVHFPEDTLAVVIGRDWKKENYNYLRTGDQLGRRETRRIEG